VRKAKEEKRPPERNIGRANRRRRAFLREGPIEVQRMETEI